MDIQSLQIHFDSCEMLKIKKQKNKIPPPHCLAIIGQKRLVPGQVLAGCSGDVLSIMNM